MSSFEVVDKRGGLKEWDTPTKVENPKTTGTWKSVDYLLAFMPQQNGSMIIIGRCVGLRNDSLPFTADFWFTPVWKHNREWEKAAKKRLDTFLGCECSPAGPCSTHKMILPEWIKQDQQRLNLAASEPLSEAIEILMRAEMARQSAKPKILIPKG